MDRATIIEWELDGRGHITNLGHHVSRLLSMNGLKDISVIDVGANVGHFIDELNERGHTVMDAILVEPVAPLFDYLKEKFPRFKHVNKVASDHSGVRDFVLSLEGNLGISRVLNNIPEVITDSRFIKVEATTLSTLIDEHKFVPDLIKIDAEGHDMQVLYGLIDFLKERDERPMIIFEISGNDSITDIVDTVKSLEFFGYEYYCPHPSGASRDAFLVCDMEAPTDWFDVSDLTQ